MPTASGTSTCSRTARPQLGPPRRPARARGRAALWFERGVAGVRIDSAALPPSTRNCPTSSRASTRTVHRQDELHDIYRSWRALADEYGGVFVGESGCRTPNASPATSAPTNRTPRSASTSSPAPGTPAGCAAPSTTPSPSTRRSAPRPPRVLCNHDVTRTVTRYGRADTAFDFATKAFGTPTDLALGTRRAAPRPCSPWPCPAPSASTRARNWACRGGDTAEPHQDPMHFRSAAPIRPRRLPVPLPWTADAPAYGSGSVGEPWLPQPDDWAQVRRRPAERPSRLMLASTAPPAPAPVRAARLRDGPMSWLPAADGVLASPARTV